MLLSVNQRYPLTGTVPLINGIPLLKVATACISELNATLSAKIPANIKDGIDVEKSENPVPVIVIVFVERSLVRDPTVKRLDEV